MWTQYLPCRTSCCQIIIIQNRRLTRLTQLQLRPGLLSLWTPKKIKCGFFSLDELNTETLHLILVEDEEVKLSLGRYKLGEIRLNQRVSRPREMPLPKSSSEAFSSEQNVARISPSQSESSQTRRAPVRLPTLRNEEQSTESIHHVISEKKTKISEKSAGGRRFAERNHASYERPRGRKKQTSQGNAIINQKKKLNFNREWPTPQRKNVNKLISARAVN